MRDAWQESSQIEEVLQELWRDATGSGDESNWDCDFFQSGGSSVDGLRLLASIRRHFDVSIEVRTLFSGDLTIRRLAEQIRNQRQRLLVGRQKEGI